MKWGDCSEGEGCLKFPNSQLRARRTVSSLAFQAYNFPTFKKSNQKEVLPRKYIFQINYSLLRKKLQENYCSRLYKN